MYFGTASHGGGNVVEQPNLRSSTSTPMLLERRSPLRLGRLVAAISGLEPHGCP